ncbi:MAG TPA: molecular chaperone DnaK, partial [Thermoclostridium sp.]|nr:molecular chaperone DnaK [Thermoclostridium sp.]
ELNTLKEVVKGDDVEAIKSATEKLSQAFYAVSEKLYQQDPNAAGGAEGFNPDIGGEAGNQDDVFDADYKVVDDEEDANN